MVRKYLTTTDPAGKLQMRGTLKSLLRELSSDKMNLVENYLP
jgi:hypothetical protein